MAALLSAGLTAYDKKDWLAQLLALNQQVAANIEQGSPAMPRRAEVLSGREETGDGGLHSTTNAMSKMKRASCLLGP